MNVQVTCWSARARGDEHNQVQVPADRAMTEDSPLLGNSRTAVLGQRAVLVLDRKVVAGTVQMAESVQTAMRLVVERRVHRVLVVEVVEGRGGCSLLSAHMPVDHMLVEAEVLVEIAEDTVGIAGFEHTVRAKSTRQDSQVVATGRASSPKGLAN